MDLKYLLLMGYNSSWTLSILFAGRNSWKNIRNFQIRSFLASNRFDTTVSQLVNKQPCYTPVVPFLVHFHHSTLTRSSRPCTVRINVRLHKIPRSPTRSSTSVKRYRRPSTYYPSRRTRQSHFTTHSRKKSATQILCTNPFLSLRAFFVTTHIYKRQQTTP